MSDIRQDLSNNNHLAHIFVSSNLHQKIRYQSPGIYQQLTSYSQQHSSRDIAAPKIIADVFEALIAAIFFDCGNSLEIVWKIIEPFLGKFLSMNI